MIGHLAIIAVLAIVVKSTTVGECRLECVELNLYKHVRVHLKEDLVMIGICQNITATEGVKSKVTPFICNRKHGIWKFDEADEEGKAPFQGLCPPIDPVPPRQLATCPQFKKKNSTLPSQ